MIMERRRALLLAELAAAFAAGIVAALQTLLSKHLYHGHIPMPFYLNNILFALLSYLAVALLLHRFWTGPKRVVPNWILIGFLGSVLFVLIRLAPGVIGGWYDPLRSESSLLSYLLNEIDAATSVVIVLSAITLPVTALAYYLSRRVMRTRVRTRP